MEQEGYLYLRNTKVDADSKIGAKWSKRFCSLVVDPKRGPFFVARKRIEEEYGEHSAIEHHVPFATSVVKLANYRVAVEEDTSAGPASEVGGVIRLTHETLDVVELRDKSLDRAKKWAISIKSTLKAWDMCPPTPATSGRRSPQRGREQEENRRNDSNVIINKRKSVAFEKGVNKDKDGNRDSGEYKATMAKFNNDQMIMSAAQQALVVTSETSSGSKNSSMVGEQDENDYKESLKAKAQSQVLLMDSKRRFLEEKRAAELEERRRRQREEDEESAQKEMSQLLAEAEKRQAEKQRLLEESQLQTEDLQRKALAAAKRAEDMISKNEAEMQKLLGEANRKKEFAEQLSRERAEEERQKKIQEEMMRQLEEQRRERERLEREEAQRRKEQEEIEALKATLEKKLQGHVQAISPRGYGMLLPVWVIMLSVCVAALLGCLMSGGSSAALMPYLDGWRSRRLYEAKFPSFIRSNTPPSLMLPSGRATEGSFADITAGVSTSEHHHVDVEEVLREAPRDQLVAALSSLADSRDFDLNQSSSGATDNDRHLTGRNEDAQHLQRKLGIPNVFRALLSALASPLVILKSLIKRLAS